MPLGTEWESEKGGVHSSLTHGPAATQRKLAGFYLYEEEALAIWNKSRPNV